MLPMRMLASAQTEAHPSPLTQLTEEEQLFQSTVRRFAREQIAPARARDGRGRRLPQGHHPPVLRAGPDGHRDSRGIWRPGRQLLPVRAGGRGAVGGRSLGRRDRRCAEHHRQQRHPALGQRANRSSNICRAWPPTRWRPTRSRKPVRAPTPSPWPRSAGSRRSFPAQRPQALDHQRRRGRPVSALRQRQSQRRISRHHGVSHRARFPRLPGGQEGRQARPPGLVHVRADSRQLPRAARERDGRSRARATRSPSRRSTKGASPSARR